jgi:hypothetical protein
LIPGTFWKLRSSGKFETPCERMQRAKFSMSCWAWAWLALVWPPELDGLGELEPHAAITVATAIASAVRVSPAQPSRHESGALRVRPSRCSAAGRTCRCNRSTWSPLSGADVAARWVEVRIVREPEIKLKRSGSSADLQAASGTIGR